MPSSGWHARSTVVFSVSSSYSPHLLPLTLYLAINYRLAPQYPFPCAIQDIVAACEFGIQVYCYLDSTFTTQISSSSDHRKVPRTGLSSQSTLSLQAILLAVDYALLSYRSCEMLASPCLQAESLFRLGVT